MLCLNMHIYYQLTNTNWSSINQPLLINQGGQERILELETTRMVSPVCLKDSCRGSTVEIVAKIVSSMHTLKGDGELQLKMSVCAKESEIYRKQAYVCGHL